MIPFKSHKNDLKPWNNNSFGSVIFFIVEDTFIDISSSNIQINSLVKSPMLSCQRERILLPLVY